MRKVLAGLAGLAMMGGAVLAAAQPARQGQGQGRHRPDPAMMKQQLGLTDDQAAQLRRLWSDERKQAIRRRADTQIARMELDEALAAAKIDEKAVAAKAQALGDLQAAALRARVDARLAVAKVLTPEQREKMKQLRHERWGREGGRPGRDGRGRGHGFERGPAGRPEGPSGPAVLEGGDEGGR